MSCSPEFHSHGLVGEYIHGQQHLLKEMSRKKVLPVFPSVAAPITSLFSMCFSILMKFRGLYFIFKLFTAAWFLPWIKLITA